MVDIVGRRALRFEGAKGLEMIEGPVPPDMAEEVEARRAELVERVSEVRGGAGQASVRGPMCCVCGQDQGGQEPGPWRHVVYTRPTHIHIQIPLHTQTQPTTPLCRLMTTWLRCSCLRSPSRRPSCRQPSGAPPWPTSLCPSSWAAHTRTRVREGATGSGCCNCCLRPDSSSMRCVVASALSWVHVLHGRTRCLPAHSHCMPPVCYYLLLLPPLPVCARVFLALCRCAGAAGWCV